MSGPSKQDNNEILISLKAIQMAYLYSVIFLFLWAVIEMFNNQNYQSPALFLLVTQNFVLFISKRSIKTRTPNYSKED